MNDGNPGIGILDELLRLVAKQRLNRLADNLNFAPQGIAVSFHAVNDLLNVFKDQAK